MSQENTIPKYAKSARDYLLDYAPVEVARDTAIDLQVTLGDMPLDEAFELALSSHFAQLTVGSMLNEIFAENEVNRAETLASFDTKTNPDQSDLYAELLNIFDQWRRGDCELTFFANFGPEIHLYGCVSDHLSVRRASSNGAAIGNPVLSLVIEQRYDAISRFAQLGGDKQGLLEWMRGITFIYFMDKHGYSPPADASDELDAGLLDIAENLASRDLIATNEDTDVFEITDEGRQILGQLISETESYIDRYDVFKDVAIDIEAESIEFDTGAGADLRVQVYQDEGVEPTRAVFLLRLYDGTFDTYAANWQYAIQDEEFFNEILRPVLDHQEVDEELIDAVIEGGFAYIEELEEESSARRLQQDTIRRLRSE